jgi:hypothetical protein
MDKDIQPKMEIDGSGDRLPFDKWLKQTTGLTDEEKVMMKLRYG